MSDENDVVKIVLNNSALIIFVGLIFLNGLINCFIFWLKIMKNLLRLLKNSIRNLRIKLIFFLVGDRSLITNCVFLSGHVVPKHSKALFSNCSFAKDVMISGQKASDIKGAEIHVE